MNYDDMRPIKGEDQYVEFDPEFGYWAVFGTESGFCYSQHCRKEDAEIEVSRHTRS